MKAIILARVSSAEQEEGHSIAAQELRLRDYCARRNMDILRCFSIVESSTRGERKAFHEMIAFARLQKERVAIVSDAVDRVQRTFSEYVMLDELRRSAQTELHFFREGLIINEHASASDIMRWDFSIIAAKSYVMQLSENVKRSLDWKVKNGQVTGPAPLGYLNEPNEQGKNWVIPDPVRSGIVRQIFHEYATGLYTLGDMVRKAADLGLRTKKGLKITKSALHHMLRNPFFYGEMECKGTLHPHSYTPLISRAVFDKCQSVLNGWNKKPFKYAGKEFIYRGLVTCAVSGRVVSADRKVKVYASGKKGEWVYLVADDPFRPGKKVFVKEEEVSKQVENALRSLYIPNEVYTGICEALRGSFESERDFHQQQMNRIAREEKAVTQKLNRLTDLLLEESITPAEHKAKRLELTRQQADLLSQRKMYQSADGSYRTSLETLLTLASSASQAFAVGNETQKRQIVNFVFSNLQLRGKNLEYTIAEPFSFWPKEQKTEKWLRG